MLFAAVPATAQPAPEANSAATASIRPSQFPIPERRKVENAAGEPVTLLVYRLPDPVVPHFSIGDRYWIAQRLAAFTEPTDFAFECPIRATGYAGSDCSMAGSIWTAPLGNPQLALAAAASTAVPPFPSMEEGDELWRSVQFTVRYDPADTPVIDWDSGDLVAVDELRELTRLRYDYPPAALRAGVNGDITVLCQIQADLSAACRTEAVDSERPDLFAGVVEWRRPRAHVPATLADGRSTVGLRKKFRISFRMGD